MKITNARANIVRATSEISTNILTFFECQQFVTNKLANYYGKNEAANIYNEILFEKYSVGIEDCWNYYHYGINS